MSIIHDALKKVENSPNINTGGASSGSGNFWQSAQGSSRKVAVAAGIGSAVAALVIASLFIQYRGVVFTAGATARPSAKATKALPQNMPAVSVVNNAEAKTPAGSLSDTVRAAASTPENEELEIRGKRGLSFYSSGRYSDAVEEFKTAIATSHDAAKQSIFYNNLGQAYSRLDEHDAAETAFLKAIKLNSAHPEAFNNYGVLLLKKGNYAKALDLFNNAVSLRKDYAEAYLNSAISFEYMKRQAEAVTAYEKFLSLNSAKPDGVRQENTTEIQKRLRSIKAGMLAAD